jgi:hypothetical protein
MVKKRRFWISLGSTLLFFILIGIGACDVLDICGGYGYLKLTNDSRNTIQKIRIDGVNYGTLDPGDSETFELTVGKHTVETLNAVTGRNACSSFEVTIVECDTQGYSCSG